MSIEADSLEKAAVGVWLRSARNGLNTSPEAWQRWTGNALAHAPRARPQRAINLPQPPESWTEVLGAEDHGYV